jgi:hypothetical protein
MKKNYTTKMKYKVYPLHSLKPFSFTAKSDTEARVFCDNKYGTNGYKHLQREDFTDHSKKHKEYYASLSIKNMAKHLHRFYKNKKKQ